ncbi:phosphatase PAP2 family protein [Solitalea sp. MAHUQ-68]|uniref:Phosphatase PAP2 family protein n=1 Tax=Solitalea agri TaxID=2953739 RepID=A0A9X2JBI2_9SPHI|nr:phosphatase PAP2 family protein [Solitalea agri]MCO4291474.1 phosphatase PAP2 family protein [Solitalea agri]
MLEQLNSIDQKAFFFVNSDLSNSFFDWLMPLMRYPAFWAPLYLFLIIFFIKEYKIKGLYLIAFLLITFAIADFVSASIIKEYFRRLRPCNDPALMGLVKVRLSRCSGGFSFISSHASNHFAIATFLISTFYQRWKWVLPVAFFWAAIICFAQVYVGVHYPFDVFCGGIFGIVVGYSVSKLRKSLVPIDGIN